jgi:two-component system, chemotaxis family, sensor kinase Cph1
LAPALRRAINLAEEVQKRRLAEEALRQSESRYRLLAEATPNFVWAADQDGKVIFVNQQFYRYTDLTWEDITDGSWNRTIHPDDLPHVRAGWQSARETNEGFELEFRCLRASDHSYRWHLGRVTPLLDDGGKAWQWLGTASDIETQKRAEQALRRSNEELQQFAFAASHDLQEPLRNISTFTQLLARRYGTQLDEEAQEYIRFAVEGAQRMNALIHDLLTYARVSMQEAAPHRVSMESVLLSVLNNLRLAVEESQAVITHEKLPDVTANTMQMFQLLQNLISNAVKYRNPDRQLKVHIEAVEAPGEWIFSVQDNGQGFDPAYSERIFGVFHRLHSREIPGTGIGLSICKRIVERHGGHIWVKSRPGQGSTFYFSIPALRM